ncbi:MAG: NHL repeat-containing protein, partial [Bacteroidota bacterium]
QWLMVTFLFLVFFVEPFTRQMELFGWADGPRRFGNFVHASSLSIDPQGNIYVADAGNNRILKFSPGGKFLAEVGGYGWGEQEFDRPYDVSATSGLNVFVADYGNHRIQRYDRSFNFISTLYTREDADAAKRFGYPTAIALSRQGDLFVADGENNRILKITPFNTVERLFGGFDAGLGRLIRPRQIEVGPHDWVYVLDEQQVVVFDYFGNYVRTIGTTVLRQPTGLTFDDHLYVADGETIHVFDESGKFVESITVAELVQSESMPVSIIDVGIYRSSLYILTPTELLLSSRQVK